MLKQRIRAARAEIPADLTLRGGRVVNTFSGVIQECDVAVYDGTIVGLGPDYHGRDEIDARGKWVVPGLIDGHMHIESSMLLPSQLAAVLLPHGTTTIVSDPHEIGNVMGMEGIRLMLRDSASIPLDVFLMAPSCVPATSLETSGAQLRASDLEALKDEPRVLGLAEMMDFPGVLQGIPQVLEKLILFEDRIIDGHAPSLRGKDLQAYLTAGIESDHETHDRCEGMEKINSGMMLMIREGTSAKNLEALLPLITESNARRCCFVSDDLHPRDILRRGHMDFIIGKAIRMGLNPVTAIRMATINPAEYFGLRDRGAIAPGCRADLVVLRDLDGFSVEKVYKDGTLVAEDGEIPASLKEGRTTFQSSQMKISPITPESFRIRSLGSQVRVIEIIPEQIVTGGRVEELRSVDGWVVSDPGSDLLKLAVVERHRGSGRIGMGLVRGFGLKKGAMASSVAHDSHNVITVGVDDLDLWSAVEAVKALGGGLVVVNGGKVLAEAPLQIAGLMSMEPLGRLVDQLDEVDRAAAALGCAIHSPFMSLSFLSLPVIPALKLTDRGLVDVKKFEIVPLFV